MGVCVTGAARLLPGAQQRLLLEPSDCDAMLTVFVPDRILLRSLAHCDDLFALLRRLSAVRVLVNAPLGASRAPLGLG